MKKTVIIGATTNPERYAFLAAERLSNSGHYIVPVGIREGEVFGKKILNLKEQPLITEVDTVTMYLGPKNQEPWYEYILSLKPRRVIFNPGTENVTFEKKLQSAGIVTIQGCTLVMLSIGSF